MSRSALVLSLLAVAACGGASGIPHHGEAEDPNGTVVPTPAPGPAPTPAADGVLADAACPRVPELLVHLNRTVVDCDADDECPAGSACDPKERRCMVECLPTVARPDGGCPAAAPCSCAGRCEPSEPERLARRRSPRAAVHFDQGTVLVGRHDRAGVALRPALRLAATQASSAARLSLRASPGLEVACGDGGAWAATCALWLESAARAGGATPVGEARVRVATGGAAVATGAIRYTAPGMAPAAGSLRVLVDAEATAPAPLRDGDRLSGQAAWTEAGPGLRPTFPLTAAVEVDAGRPLQLVVHDATHVVLPEGVLRLTPNTAQRGQWLWTRAIDGRRPHAATWDAFVTRRGDEEGFEGTLTVSLPGQGTLRWRLCLDPDAGRVASNLGGTGGSISAAGTDRPAAGDRGPSAGGGHHATLLTRWSEICRAGGTADKTLLALPHSFDAAGRAVARTEPDLRAQILGPYAFDWQGEAPNRVAARLATAAALDAQRAGLYDGVGAINQFSAAFAALEPRAGADGMLCTHGGQRDADGLLALMDCAHVAPTATAQGRCATLPGLRTYYERPGGPASGYDPTRPQLPVDMCPPDLDLASSRAALIARTLCFDAARAGQDAGMVSRELDVAATDGGRPLDLVCAGGAPQHAFPLFAPPLPGRRTASGSMLARCLLELGRLPSQPVPAAWEDAATVFARARAAWAESASEAQCFSPAHFHTALAEALDGAADDLASERLLQRMLVQWGALHVFIAEEATREDEMGAFLRADATARPGDASPGPGPRGAGLAQARLAVQAGWEFLLDAPVGDAIARMSAAALVAPTLPGQPPAAAATPGAGRALPVALLEGAASLARIAVAGLDGEAVGVAEPLRLATSLAVLAETLHARALAAEPVLAWAGPWRTARDDFSAALQQAQLALARGTDDPSTLGLDELEVPLYARDVAGPTDRFFASSEYILHQYALPALDRAGAMLDAGARATWSAMAQADLYEETRVDELQARYGRPLAVACGFPEQGAGHLLPRLARREVELDGCFVRAGCSAASGDPAARVRCFRGALGEAAAAIVAAEQDVAHAQAVVAAQSDRYVRHADHCLQIAREHEVDEALTASYQHELGAIAALRSEADHALVDVRAAAEIFAAGDPATMVLRLVTSGARAHAEHRIVALRRRAEAAEAAFATLVQRRGHAREQAACDLEADGLREQTVLAALQIEQRLTALTRDVLRLENGVRQTAGLAAEGLAALARETERGSVASIYRHWLAADLDAFRDQFRWAKRTVYLALRAQEYELQRSSELRGTVLRARHPAELRGAVLELLQHGLPRRLGERRPEARQLTISLRDDVLKLADHTGTAGGRRHGSPGGRMAHLLAGDDGAIYDDRGIYRGQGLRFSLAPAMVPDECAERVWRVTASIRGAFPTKEPVSVRVRLVKAPVFSSQWCAPPGADAAPLQFASLPLGGTAAGEAGGGSHGGTVVLLQARRDIARTHFEDQAFAEGSSTELSGQGLLGEYVVTLDPEQAAPPARIDDIWLRFDYVSVARGGG